MREVPVIFGPTFGLGFITLLFSRMLRGFCARTISSNRHYLFSRFYYSTSTRTTMTSADVSRRSRSPPTEGPPPEKKPRLDSPPKKDSRTPLTDEQKSARNKSKKKTKYIKDKRKKFPERCSSEDVLWRDVVSLLPGGQSKVDEAIREGWEFSPPYPHEERREVEVEILRVGSDGAFPFLLFSFVFMGTEYGFVLRRWTGSCTRHAESMGDCRTVLLARREGANEGVQERAAAFLWRPSRGDQTQPRATRRHEDRV